LIRRAGFTIAELAVATGVGGVLFTAGMTAFVTLQRAGVTYTVAADSRANQVRLLEALQRDLRSASACTFKSDGTLPITMKLPNRYRDYETTGNRAGEPLQDPTLARLTVDVDPKSGRAKVTGEVTVRFFSQTTSSGIVVNREVTWTNDGVSKTASRAIGNFSADASIKVLPEAGTKPTSATITIQSAAAATRSGRAPVASRVTETVFLRGLAYR
jgi:type II secretory pathway pseudopilin PulG